MILHGLTLILLAFVVLWYGAALWLSLPVCVAGMWLVVMGAER